MATADCKLRSHWLSCRQSFAPIGCSCAKLLFLNSENFLRTLYRKVVQIPVTSLKCVGMYGKACFKASRGLYETKLFSYAGACARRGARAARRAVQKQELNLWHWQYHQKKFFGQSVWNFTRRSDISSAVNWLNFSQIKSCKLIFITKVNQQSFCSSLIKYLELTSTFRALHEVQTHCLSRDIITAYEAHSDWLLLTASWALIGWAVDDPVILLAALRKVIPQFPPL